MSQGASTNVNRDQQTSSTDTKPRRRSQVESFRELAERIQTQDSEQRFEEALRAILHAKARPKRGKQP